MIRAAKFGLLDPVSGFDAAAQEHLFLRNKLWNNLVELEREHKARYRALFPESDAELELVQNRLDSIERAKADLLSRKKQLRAKERSKKADTAALDVEIGVLIAERKSLGARARELRVLARQTLAPRIAELEQARYDKVKQLVAASGLWWGNSETVVAAYDTARVKAMKDNAELRFKSFDGTGKFAVRQAGGFLLEELMQGTLSFARIRALPDEQFSHLSARGMRSKARHELTMTVFTTRDESSRQLLRHEVTWPIVLHQPVPVRLIKQLHVQRRRVGSEFHWSCSVVVQTDAQPPALLDHPSRLACGIDLGFRLVKEGLRVAVIAGSDGTAEHVVLPARWLKRMDHVERLQAVLAEMANAAWVDLRRTLAHTDGLPDTLRERASRLLRAGDKVPINGMRALRNALLAAPGLLPSALQILDGWQQAILRVSHEMHNLRDKLIAQRNDIYRNLAHSIAQRYSLVRIEDMKLKSIAVVNTEDGSDNPLPAAVRNNRQRAALFELALYISQACVKSGAEFEKMDAAYSSITCSSCGQGNAGVEDIFFTCRHCGALHDQDENSARNFLLGAEFYRRSRPVATAAAKGLLPALLHQEECFTSPAA
ncbi:zinc ribbon domain-containing protein [Undibacterium sp. TJN25]|uniref:zinc ribbon domain-containing protein n=1 Tax=Undibacterium sp. TJN25 TaxID=3413056 RepID=UPI003BF21714